MRVLTVHISRMYDGVLVLDIFNNPSDEPPCSVGCRIDGNKLVWAAGRHDSGVNLEVARVDAGFHMVNISWSYC